MADITVNSLSHTYSIGTPFEKTAIHDISLSIKQGENICVLGHTGSGKSTFIQHLNALLQPTSGEILVDGENINRNKVSRRDIKRRIGLVFQYPEYQLFEETVFQDIAFGPRSMKIPDAEIEARVREAADFGGVEESLFERSPLELSGGQKRRIAIAGVIAMQPEVLILDEPTAGLDPEGCRQIMENISRYHSLTNATIIIVSHNMNDAAKYSNRLLVFNHGTVYMDGSPEQVFSKAEELVTIGLDIPTATEIALDLKNYGIQLNGAVFTHEQLLHAIHSAEAGAVC